MSYFETYSIRVAVCCSVLLLRNVLYACCSVLQLVAGSSWATSKFIQYVYIYMLYVHTSTFYLYTILSALKYVATRCSVLQLAHEQLQNVFYMHTSMCDSICVYFYVRCSVLHCNFLQLSHVPLRRSLYISLRAILSVYNSICVAACCSFLMSHFDVLYV